MQVSVEKVSNIERRLTITVPADQVEAAYNKQLDQLAKKAKIDGFRPGKVPLSFVKQRFGEDARREALSDVIQRTLYEALQEQKLQPISQPRIEPKVITPDQPLEFVASFEILPDMGPIQFKLNQLEKLMVDVQPDDVQRVIQQLQKQYATWTVVERPAKEKDRVVIDYHAVFEGKADSDNQVKDFPLELGSKVMLAGFEEGLVGATANETRTLSSTFPADFPDEAKAGKPVEFVVTVKQIYEADIPALDEALIQKMGVKSGNEEDLKTQIKQSLDQERDRLVREKVKEQVFRELLAQNPIDVPMALVAREARRIHDEMYPDHQHHDHQHSAEETAAFNEIAKKRVGLGLLISEYAKQTDLKVDGDRVNQRIQDIAAVYEYPEEVAAWLSSSERRSGIEAQVLEEQVMDKLLEGVPVTEKNMTYAELKGIRI